MAARYTKAELYKLLIEQGAEANAVGSLGMYVKQNPLQ